MEGHRVDFAEKLRKEDQERYERHQQELKAEWEAARIVRCPIGHFYNATTYDSCPECKPKEPRRREIVHCPNGHYYDSNVFAACPICTEENPPENSEIVSLGEGPRMVKYRVTRCSNNHHYISSFEKDCPFCAYKPYDTTDYEDHYFDFDWSYFARKDLDVCYTLEEYPVDELQITNPLFTCPHCGRSYRPSIFDFCTSCFKDAPEEVKRNPYELKMVSRPIDIKWFHTALKPDPVQQRPVVGKLRCTDRIAQEVSWNVHAGDNVIAQVKGAIPIIWDKQVGKEQHACISYNSEDHSFRIAPLGDNAVSVNDEPVSTEAVLHDGDVIAVGVTHLVFSPLPEDVLKTII